MGFLMRFPMDGKMTFEKKLVDKGSLSSDDESDGRPQVPKVVADRFDISRKLGSGSYSVVRLAWDRIANRYVALKFEWTKAEKTDKLLKEAELCQVFGLDSPTTTVHWCGSQDEYNIMAMGLLGPSLEDLFMKTCRRKFSLKTVLMLGEQMINCIEFVHSHKILHRDIKPSNFVVGAGDGQNDKVYIVDFGLAKRFRDPDTGKHIPFVKKSGITGTARYVTVNLHQGCEPSRRDDLGSIGYVLLYFLRGKLPWQGINHRDKKKRKTRIGKRKAATSHQDLCKSFPKEFVQYLEYCDSLGFKDKPDYDHLRSLFRKAASRHQLDFDWQFDWLTPRQKRKRAPVSGSPSGKVESSTYESYESYEDSYSSTRSGARPESDRGHKKRRKR
ncbi:CKL1 [Symbiodinium necroappetens]|uniref:Casein kinase I n=1 Tax=Symbiodinium necroappetens TaxID=1628268 RepID=A0A812KP55_9DINO|nr:CKL1 [Symbiodinium necroappetens]